MTTYSIDVNADNYRQVVVEGSKVAPVVIDFWAPWCGPCRALKPILEKLAQEYDGKFTLAKINSDENQELAASMGVRGIPAVKAMVDGELVDEFAGALPESQVREFIERIVPSPSSIEQKRARQLMDDGQYAAALAPLDTALQLDPRNEPARIDQLEALVRLGHLDKAHAALESLHPLSLGDARVCALKAELEFAAGAHEDAPALERRIHNDPDDLDARLKLARHHVHLRAHEQAMQQLMEIVRRNREYGGDAGRKTLIELFNLLGNEHELVGRYRRLLSAALY